MSSQPTFQRRQSQGPVTGFDKVRRAMPRLLSEMKADLERNSVVRELFVLKGSYMLRTDLGAFVYFEAHHAGLRLKLRVLESAKCVEDVTFGSTPRYRMTDQFAEYLLSA